MNFAATRMHVRDKYADIVDLAAVRAATVGSIVSQGYDTSHSAKLAL